MYQHAVEPLLEKFYRGDNCVLFAYGMTNAGKTYTIQGSLHNPGILPRLVSSILDKMDQMVEPRLNISMLEIYQEKIYDLLARRRENLSIRDANGRVEVAKLSHHPVKSTTEAFMLMDTAASKR